MAGQELRDVLRKRLRYQGLAGAPFTGVADVVGWLGAVQSQEYAWFDERVPYAAAPPPGPVTAAVDRYAGFLDLPPSLTIQDGPDA
jgi:hypothetical protein